MPVDCQDGEDPRLWIASVDAERRLKVFETCGSVPRLARVPAEGCDLRGAHRVAWRDPERIHEGALIVILDDA